MLHETFRLQHSHFLWMPTLIFWSHLCGDREKERRGRGREGRAGGTRGRESVHLDFLSSVAVVGQGRPSLGDAHYQFFWRTEHKKTSIKTQVTAQKAHKIKCCEFIIIIFLNMEATQGLIMWYRYGWLHSCAVTITRCLSLLLQTVLRLTAKLPASYLMILFQF